MPGKKLGFNLVRLTDRVSALRPFLVLEPLFKESPLTPGQGQEGLYSGRSDCSWARAEEVFCPHAA